MKVNEGRAFEQSWAVGLPLYNQNSTLSHPVSNLKDYRQPYKKQLKGHNLPVYAMRATEIIIFQHSPTITMKLSPNGSSVTVLAAALVAPLLQFWDLTP